MFEEYEVVELSEDISERLHAGARGTVLVVYDKPPLPRAYEVEFLDEQGKTIDVLTLEETKLAPVGQLRNSANRAQLG